MCYQEHNRDEIFSPVRTLGRRCLSIRKELNNKKTYFSAYWVGIRRKDLTSENMSVALKFAATALSYPSLKGIPIDIVDTYFLISGGG